MADAAPVSIVALDWTALLLCISALALVTWKHTDDRKVNAPTLAIDSSNLPNDAPNIALPSPDDARLQLAHSLSHELRTPLNAVIGFNDLMQHQLHGNLGHPKYKEYCEHISTSSQNLLKAVDDILALNLSASLDIQKRVPLPVAEALTAAWEENNVTDARSKLDLQINGDQQQSVLADPAMLSHALGNMLSAVARHCADGTTVSATIDGDSEQTRIRCYAEVDQSRMTETAPLVSATGTTSDKSGNNLTEAAARALIARLDGQLTVSKHHDRNRLEFVCKLPSANESGSGLEHTPHKGIAA